MPDLVRPRRALLSVSDKAGLIDLARELHRWGVELISTGGTARALADAGLPVTPVERVTGFPEMMDGRVKTLHPLIHGGLLGMRDNPEHVRAMNQHAIAPIDLLCVNLYPFAQTIARPGCTRHDAIENIDIGGPAMVRSAAKNHQDVAVLTSPEQYPAIIDELRARDGCTGLATRERLCAEAFTHTARYDAAISAYLLRELAEKAAAAPGAGVPAPSHTPEALPTRFEVAMPIAQTLRYGENPHQRAAVYAREGSATPSVVNARQLHGKELSYNNIADASAALELAWALSERTKFQRPAAAVIKHANPCGAAVAGTLARAVDRAIAGDPVAAFGGIIACSHELDEAAATRLAGKDTFLEVVLAPSITPAALEVLKARSANVRLLEVGALRGREPERLMFRSIPGGMLVQDRDLLPPDSEKWTHAAGPSLSNALASLADLEVLEIMGRAVASNAVVLGARDEDSFRLIGVGVGQVDRVTSCRLCVEKARQFSRGLLESGMAVAYSDAFFPFDDGPKVLIDAGARAIVQPGGSKRDAETFAICNERGVTCLITGTRRFRH
jgi:phosphoribosylaminoimidazolecarboxamide formyltransferase/IMP cyclohydrolase